MRKIPSLPKQYFLIKENTVALSVRVSVRMSVCVSVRVSVPMSACEC